MKEKIRSALTGDRSSLGRQWRLEELETDLKGESKGAKEQHSGKGSKRSWEVKQGKSGFCSWTADSGPGEAHRGLVGCDDQFDFYPKSTRKASKGVKHGSSIISFVILDHSSWRTGWQEERVKVWRTVRKLFKVIQERDQGGPPRHRELGEGMKESWVTWEKFRKPYLLVWWWPGFGSKEREVSRMTPWFLVCATQGNSNTDGAWEQWERTGLGRGRAGFKIQNLIWVVMAQEPVGHPAEMSGR